MRMVDNLSEQQISEIIRLFKEIDEDCKGYNIILKFANKCTTEEMMMRVAMDYKPELTKPIE